MKTNPNNLRTAAWLMSIMLFGGVADVAAMLFLPHPFPWTVILPASIPVLFAVYMIIDRKRFNQPASSKN